MRQGLETLERANELERELVRAGEREQMRLGQDLHDGVCQTLAALNCAAECLRLDLEADVSPRVKIATEIQKSLSEATLEVRNLARGIYPIWKEGETIVSAVRSLVTRLNTLCRGRIEFRSCGDVLPLEPENAIHLYRITQEALQNAMRHANASRIFVEVAVDDESLTLTVGDDGCGSAVQMRPDGIGWRTMKYRAKLIGANISFASPKSGGTLVRCALPLSALAGNGSGAPVPMTVPQ
jgi:signal transduction histidine kinase